jgi:hypothetical protein
LGRAFLHLEAVADPGTCRRLRRRHEPIAPGGRSPVRYAVELVDPIANEPAHTARRRRHRLRHRGAARVLGPCRRRETIGHAGRRGERALAVEPLYREEDGHYQFKDLPEFAVLAIPVGLASLETAETIWFSLSIVALIVLLRTSVRLLPEQRRPSWLLMAAAVVVLGKFYAHELVLGQVNLLFAAVATGAILALKVQREALAGVLVALAIVLKPYGMLLVPWLVARWRPRAIAGVSAAAAAAAVLTVFLYGVDGSVALHREWLRTVVDTTATNLLNVDNVSWLAMYSRWYGPGTAAPVLAMTTTVAALGLLAWMWRAGHRLTFPDGLEGAVVLLLIPLISPQGWDYVLLLSTAAVIYLVNYWDRLPAVLRPATLVALGVIGLAIFDLMGRAAYGAFMRMSGVTLCFFVVIAALAALRQRRVA